MQCIALHTVHTVPTMHPDQIHYAVHGCSSKLHQTFVTIKADAARMKLFIGSKIESASQGIVWTQTLSAHVCWNLCEQMLQE